MNKSMKVWSKRRLKIRDSRRDIDAEVLEAMAQVHRGEGTVVFQGDDCPYPVGTRLPLSAHALMDIPITEDELKAHIMNDEVTRMYPHVIKPIALNKETVQNADCAVEQRTSSILVFEAEEGESEESFVNRQAHLLGITVDEVQALDSKELSERLFDTLRSGHGVGWAEHQYQKAMAGWMQIIDPAILPPMYNSNSLSDGVNTLVVDSVCLMVHDVNGKLIVVSRKDNHTDLGMPGGKIDAGECAHWAILRECAEELGVDYQPDDLQVVYVGPCGDHQTACFMLIDGRNGRHIRDGRIMEDFINKEGALVTRVDSLLDIADPTKSCFAEFNMQVHLHIQRYG